jgi:pyridoxamine 5'-phosphate oxidase
VRNDIGSLRVDYGDRGFDEAAAGDDPMKLFSAWFEDAQRNHAVVEANAMSLATSTTDGVPSVRMVLLKLVDQRRAAFTWFTNLDSRKAREAFARSPGRAALAWWWPGDDQMPGRQVRATGRVELLDRDAVATYFATRPREAQLGAAASQQSQPIASRAALEEQSRTAEREADAEGVVHLPDRWGGITLIADELEFWQGRSGRLHDRISFRRTAATDPVEPCATMVLDGAGQSWQRVRLQP